MALPVGAVGARRAAERARRRAESNSKRKDRDSGNSGGGVLSRSVSKMAEAKRRLVHADTIVKFDPAGQAYPESSLCFLPLDSPTRQLFIRFIRWPGLPLPRALCWPRTRARYGSALALLTASTGSSSLAARPARRGLRRGPPDARARSPQQGWRGGGGGSGGPQRGRRAGRGCERAGAVSRRRLGARGGWARRRAGRWARGPRPAAPRQLRHFFARGEAPPRPPSPLASRTQPRGPGARAPTAEHAPRWPPAGPPPHRACPPSSLR